MRLILMACLLGSAMKSVAATQYTRQHDVLVSAIRHGSASGVMTGEVAEHFTRELHSLGPLLVEARVIKSLAREDCKRLEMIFTKQAQ